MVRRDGNIRYTNVHYYKSGEPCIKLWEDLSKEQRKCFARVVATCTIKASADDFDLANIFDSAIEIAKEVGE